jgi:putative flippase GtrA
LPPSAKCQASRQNPKHSKKHVCCEDAASNNEAQSEGHYWLGQHRRRRHIWAICGLLRGRNHRDGCPHVVVYGLVERSGVHYSAASLVGGIAGVLWNFLLNDLLVWQGRRTRGLVSWIAAAGKYTLTRSVGLGAGLTGTVILVELGRVHYLVANLAAAAVGSVLGFLMADRLVWPEPRDARDCRRDEGDPYSARLRLLVLGVTAVLLTLSILSYVGYQSSAGDLGQYVYMFERTLRRDGFLPLPYYRAGKNEYFAAHFAPLLVVFLPVYAALPSAVTLLVTKSVLLGMSVWLFGLLARELVRNPTIALLVTAGYAFNPFLWNAWLFDFQEQVLIPPLLLGLYSLLREEG